MTFKDPRFVIAFSIILLFSGAYIFHPSETMNGALIAAFAGAWGYYLGSSSGAQRAGDRQDQAMAVAHDAIKAIPTTTDANAIRQGDTVTLDKEPTS